MKKITADTLEIAIKEATKHFNCSLTQIEYEVVQHPSNGIFGFFKKEAIIIATKKENLNNIATLPNNDSEILATKDTKEDSINNAFNKQESAVNKATYEQTEVVVTNIDGNDNIDTNTSSSDNKSSIQTESNQADLNTNVNEDREYNHKTFATNKQKQDHFSSFFSDKDLDTSWQEHANQKPQPTKDIESICKEVQSELTELLHFLPLELSKIQVEPYDSHTIFILIDGLDAALLIGQKGYRYKSLSYLLFNWINACYGYNVRLEIAQFLKNQEDMMRSYLEPIIETAKLQGKAQTKPLDGVLTHIALKMLRDALPSKYIVFRENADGEKYITISEFLNNNTRNSVNGFGNLPKY